MVDVYINCALHAKIFDGIKSAGAIMIHVPWKDLIIKELKDIKYLNSNSHVVMVIGLPEKIGMIQKGSMEENSELMMILLLKSYKSIYFTHRTKYKMFKLL